MPVQPMILLLFIAFGILPSPEGLRVAYNMQHKTYQVTQSYAVFVYNVQSQQVTVTARQDRTNYYGMVADTYNN